VSTTREPKLPGPDHPIDIAPFDGRITVTSGTRTIADTTSALELREASYPPAYYVPLADVDQSIIEPSETTSYCPYKGKASYYSLLAGDAAQQPVKDAIWHYREPYPSVSEIAEYVAFYPDRVAIEVQPAG
jgi:uncharacterized protein (DUF427 family)